MGNSSSNFMASNLPSNGNFIRSQTQVAAFLNVQYSSGGINQTLTAAFSPTTDIYSELRISGNSDLLRDSSKYGDLSSRFLYLDIVAKDRSFRSPLVPFVTNSENGKDKIYAKYRTAIVVVDGGNIQYITFENQPAAGGLSGQIPDNYNNGQFTTYGVTCSDNGNTMSEPNTGPFMCDQTKNGNDCTCEVRIYLAWVGTDKNSKTMRSFRTDIWKFLYFL